MKSILHIYLDRITGMKEKSQMIFRMFRKDLKNIANCTQIVQNVSFFNKLKLFSLNSFKGILL